jgi:uncharacterized membrane protein
MAPPGRIVGVDLARGVALLTMAATHLLVVRNAADGSLTVVGWLFAGRASALFAVLAGVSMALVTGGTTPVTGPVRRQARVAIAVRAVLIALLGLALASTRTPVIVILAYYGLLFLCGLPFLGLRSRALVWWATGWAVLSPVVSALLRSVVDPRTRGQVGFAKLADDPLRAVTELLLTGTYPVLTWTTYLLAGLAVGRMALRETRTAVRLVVTGVSLAAAAWGTSALLLALGAAPTLTSPEDRARGATWLTLLDSEAGGVLPPRSEALLLAVPHSGTTFDLVGTTGSALACLGLCLLAVRVPWLRVLSHPVAAAGTMTLTLYTAHVLVIAQDWGRGDSAWFYVVHVAVALLVATVWLRFARRGPMEEAVHRVSRTVARRVAPYDPRLLPAADAEADAVPDGVSSTERGG